MPTFLQWFFVASLLWFAYAIARAILRRFILGEIERYMRTTGMREQIAELMRRSSRSSPSDQPPQWKGRF